EGDPDVLARALEAAIEAHFGFRVPCLVVDGDPALEHLASAVPDPAGAADLLALYALITRGEP
ncbi:hypothetical protein ABT143_34380, partial [Streptomyces sp. NPDC002033]